MFPGLVAAALIAPLFALALPILDVVLAIVRRGLRGLPLFRPDCSHLHHRLQRVGLTRGRALLVLYGNSLVCLLMAFGVFWSRGRWLPILFGFLCLTLVLLAQSFSFSRQWFALPQVLERSLEVRREASYVLALSRWLELEAERVGSLEELWNCYLFLIQRVGFKSVSVTQGDASRFWESAQTTAQPLNYEHVIRAAGGMRIVIVGYGERMSEKVFEQVADLAAEAWVNAVLRWQQTHREKRGSH